MIYIHHKNYILNLNLDLASDPSWLSDYNFYGISLYQDVLLWVSSQMPSAQNAAT